MVIDHGRLRRRPWRAVYLAIAVATWIGPVTFALAASVDLRDHDVRSVFHVEKSQNRNQVHYGVHLSPCSRRSACCRLSPFGSTNTRSTAGRCMR